MKPLKKRVVKQIFKSPTKEEWALARIRTTASEYLPGKEKLALQGIIRIAKEAL